jgi:two-component system, OmpR family, sensor histidine kinase BaeS
MSLSVRFGIAFLIVAMVAVGVAAVLVNRTAAGGFMRIATEARSQTEEDLARELGAVYLETGQWDLDLFQAIGPGMVSVVDPDGRLLAGSPGMGAGRMANHRSLPITVDGVTLGEVRLAGMGGGGAGAGAGPMHLPELADDLHGRANVALVAGLAAGAAIALLLGFTFARRLTAPIRSLRDAVTAVAAGDLRRRSGISRPDEIGQLALAFDNMTGTLAAQDESRRQLLADIAHELKTPLTVLRATLQALVEGVYEPSAERLTGLIGRVDGLDRLIDELRLLSLADAGGLDLQIAPVDAGSAAAAAAARFEAIAREHAITLRTAPAESPTSVAADTHRLDQALDNLLRNALDHTPAGGIVTIGVATAAASPLVDLYVEDTGPGVPDEDLPRVFERFYRGGDGDVRPSAGTGLGLAIVRRIARAHGGEVDVRNLPDAGARFSIRLPEALPGGGPDKLA